MIRSSGFYKYAWSPIEGCNQGCTYCYARAEIEKIGNDFNKPQFFEERLVEPSQVKPCRIFVNHLSDIMGSWVPADWIKKVINVCRLLPAHEFIFMTKSPKRYFEFSFPDNCILGVTIETPEQWHRAEIMEGITNRKMCSCEPILGSFRGYDFSQFEFVVIGGLMGVKSNHKLFRTVKHPVIYRKYKS